MRTTTGGDEGIARVLHEAAVARPFLGDGRHAPVAVRVRGKHQRVVGQHDAGDGVLAGAVGAVPRMHDLCGLRRRSATEIAPHITDEMLVRVSTQWVSARYPGDWTEPTEHDAETALRVARAVVADVTRIIMEQERSR